MVRICALAAHHPVQLVEDGRTDGSLSGVQAIQDPAELAASTGPDLLDDPTSRFRELQGDDAAIVRVCAPDQVPGGVQPVGQPRHRGALHAQCLRALRRAGSAELVQHQQQPKLGERDLQRLDTAKCQSDKVPSGDLEGHEFMGRRPRIPLCHRASMARCPALRRAGNV